MPESLWSQEWPAMPRRKKDFFELSVLQKIAQQLDQEEAVVLTLREGESVDEEGI